MGLAQPRRRTKIAHDPRNLAWTGDIDSYGQRMMQQQGWKSGEALGATGRGSRYADTDAAKVQVQYKDDTLGLGASLKSKDIAHQRTGFDAFQGLLGRLNAKSEEEVKVIEKKMEDKKLAAFAHGRWGGMVFVPGGTLIQNDTFKLKLELDKKREEAAAVQQEQQAQLLNQDSTPDTNQDDAAEKLRHKEQKKLRKQEKRLRKEEKRSKKAAKTTVEGNADLGLPTPDSSSANEAETTEKIKRKRTHDNTLVEPAAKPVVIKQEMRNGRHILRGKNIMAKRAAFADMKGLDEIFMRNG